MTGRKVALGMNMSLDGYVSGPAGEGDVEELFVTMDDEVNDYFVESLRDIDTMLMGRVNYLEQAAYWPTATDALAPIVNAHEKIVFSTTLESVDWRNTRLATAGPAEEIANLKQQPGKTIGISGGARFAQSLLREGLVDEIRLTVHPVVYGAGTPLFADFLRLKPVSSRRFGSGAVLHIFEPVR
jgi:dihydrofolate reductase